jgi:hypothetical protein
MDAFLFKDTEQPYRSSEQGSSSQNTAQKLNPWQNQQQGYSFVIPQQYPFVQQDQSFMLNAQMMNNMYNMQLQQV